MRKPQWAILRDMLRDAPGNALTLREIEIEGYIRNVPDAAKQAREHGVNITTEYLHENKKIASYRLVESFEVNQSDIPLKPHPAIEKSFDEAAEKLLPDQPRSRAYE